MYRTMNVPLKCEALWFQRSPQPRGYRVRERGGILDALDFRVTQQVVAGPVISSVSSVQRSWLSKLSVSDSRPGASSDKSD
jgi:hypothetical protein